MAALSKTYQTLDAETDREADLGGPPASASSARSLRCPLPPFASSSSWTGVLRLREAIQVMIGRCVAACLVAAAVGKSEVSFAQSPTRPAPSVARTAVGSVLGVAVGGLLGAVAGGGWTSRDCPEGDPDACLGAAFPGFIWGTGVGATIGAPVGAWLGSRRNGNLAVSLLASTGLFVAEVLTLRSIVHDGRTDHKEAAIAIVIAVPVLQVIASTYLHTRP